MSKNDTKYFKEPGGGFDSREELLRAYHNGDLVKQADGTYMDRETGEEYWSDGTLKDHGWELEMDN